MANYPKTTEPIHCNQCDKTKHPSKFGKDHRRKTGAHWVCRKCDNANAKARYKADGGKKKHWGMRLYRYGITKEEFFTMVDKQFGICKICCEKLPHYRKVCIDHDHGTGEVRGLLCHRCNVLIGQIENNKHLLGNVVDYIL
jgi:hypothetical protein